MAESNPSTTIIADQSTLTLLEHVNLNVPNHDYILPFYLNLLGLGLDPRKAQNIGTGGGSDGTTVWANCGASQFHLPYGNTPQVIPGSIGLRYATLVPLKERLLLLEANNNKQNKCFKSFEIVEGERGHVKIVDRYDNVFYCRQGDGEKQEATMRQPIVSTTTADTDTDNNELAIKYGRDESECRGIDYVEFNCPIGTADKIAVFYDSVFDATTSTAVDKDRKVALIGFGTVDENGRAQQYLLFRESEKPTPHHYDGHHIALYVGQNGADFEQAFKNCETAGIVWVNPRFSDKADDLESAKAWNQYRFKDIIDMESGIPIFELEHEVRSVNHAAWPGQQ